MDDVENFYLLPLYEFAWKNFKATEVVKKVLEEECKEARFALEPWSLETVVSKKVDAGFCTCENDPTLETHCEEIAEEIDRALCQAQKFREKTINQTFNKKMENASRKISPKKSIENSEKISREPIDKEKQRKKPINYVLANKLSVKNVTKKKETDAASSNTCEKSKSNDSNNIQSRMNELINKISNFPNTSRVQSENCLFHNNVRFVEEKIINEVDIVKAVTIAKIPPKLMQVLKIREMYDNFSAEKSQRKSEIASTEKYFSCFSQMVKKSASHNFPEQLSTLSLEFMDAFSKYHETNFESRSQLKVKYTDLDMRCKLSNWRFQCKFPKTELLDFPNLAPTKIGWLSFGIWNDSMISDFSTLHRANAVRYSKKEELFEIFQAIKNLQKNRYSLNLIDLILQIIPVVKTQFCPSSEEYAEFYKMVSTIVQISNPKVTILTRTSL